MKKNILKYSFILLSVFFYCTNGYAQSGTLYYCDECIGASALCPGVTGQTQTVVASGPDLSTTGGSIPQGQLGVTISVYTDANGVQWDGWCIADQCTVGESCYNILIAPIGNGALISILLVMTYGGVLYYRRRRVA